MAKLGDILEKEKNRSETGMLRTIYLYQEGTFYRAYEWSAWLCFRYIKQFKPTHRLLKDSDDSIVFIGFPVTSLQKYTLEGGEVTYMDDNNVAVSIPENTIGDGLDAARMSADFDNWKSNVPMTESSKKKLEESQRFPNGTPPRLTDILRDVMSYPIEQHSPMECMSFLAEIKQQISMII